MIKHIFIHQIMFNSNTFIHENWLSPNNTSGVIPSIMRGYLTSTFGH